MKMSWSRYTSQQVIYIIFREGELAERAKALKVNVGTDPEADLGPVITKEVHTYLYNQFLPVNVFHQ